MIVLTQLRGSFSLTVESRRLVTTGVYRRIRHPLLAEEIAAIGVVMQFLSLDGADSRRGNRLSAAPDAKRGGHLGRDLSRISSLPRENRPHLARHLLRRRAALPLGRRG